MKKDINKYRLDSEFGIITFSDVDLALYDNFSLYQSQSFTSLTPEEYVLVKSYFPKNKKVLDYACGCGRTTIGLIASGVLTKNIIATDFQKDFISWNKKTHKGIDFRVSEYDDIITETEFGGVLFSSNRFSMIPSIRERINTLSNICDHMEVGAHLIVSTLHTDHGDFRPNLKWKEQRLSSDRDKLLENIYFHFFEDNEMESLLGTTGFTLKKILVPEIRSDARNILRPGVYFVAQK